MTEQGASNNVAVLVIDDFGDMAADGKTRLRCPILCPDPKLDGNCVVRPDGQTFATRGAGTGESETPHGVLVYTELYQELGPGSTRWYGYKKWGINWMRQVDKWDGDGARLLLVAVDTEGFKTSIISERIKQAINLFEEMGINRFVLNMSFAIVPCGLAALYEQILNSDQDISTLQDILDDYAGVIPDNVSQEEIQSLVTDPKELARILVIRASYSPYPAGKQPELSERLQVIYGDDFLGNDPLRNWLCACNEPTDRIVIPVGAAGNWGMDGFEFPFAPAIFDSVVSIGAEPVQNKEIYSNPSEVIMDGEHSTVMDDSGEPIRGTSFASPRFSAKAAIYLRNGGTGPLPGSVEPPLGYAGDEGPWDRKPYEQAKAVHAPYQDLPHWP